MALGLSANATATTCRRRLGCVTALLATLSVGAPSVASAQEPAVATTPATVSPLRRYLTREHMTGPRFLDHGVLQAAVAGGWPHRYRLQLQLGLLDHITVGATAHWLPGQDAPRWSPKVAIAFYRWRKLEFGAHYFRNLFPAPEDDDDPQTPSFEKRANWVLGTVTLSQAWFAAGFDAGIIVRREIDDFVDSEDELITPFETTTKFGGGLHMRAGTRRWGFTAQALIPEVTVELVFDLRFGLFEMRRRGGWLPPGLTGPRAGTLNSAGRGLPGR